MSIRKKHHIVHVCQNRWGWHRCLLLCVTSKLHQQNQLLNRALLIVAILYALFLCLILCVFVCSIHWKVQSWIYDLEYQHDYPQIRCVGSVWSPPIPTRGTQIMKCAHGKKNLKTKFSLAPYWHCLTAKFRFCLLCIKPKLEKNLCSTVQCST